MLLSTSRAVYRWDENIGAADHIYADDTLTAIAQGEDAQIASNENEIFDLATGETLAKSNAGPIECLIILDSAVRSFFAGTEGPHIFRYDSEGSEQIESFEKLDARKDWYTPWGGPASVRSFAQSSGGVVYADIHVGSIARSEDGGRNWEMVTPDLHEDVHQVATCPAAGDTVFANTADAVYTSEDRGRSWNHRSTGLPERYGRAIAVHPEEPDCLLATVSRGPGSDVGGTLHRSTDGGRSWTHVTDGFPKATPGNIDTFQIAFDHDGRGWAVVDTELYLSEDRGETWMVIWSAPEPIARIACGL